MEKEKKLTPRMRKFCDRYLIHYNNKQAAIEAGYAPHSAAQQATRILRDPNVQAYLNERQNKISAKEEDVAQKIRKELALLAFSDISDYLTFREDGTFFVDLSKMGETSRVLESIEQHLYWEGTGKDSREVKRIKFRLHPKLKAIELLMRHHGLLIDKHEVAVHEMVESPREKLERRLMEMAKRNAGSSLSTES